MWYGGSTAESEGEDEPEEAEAESKSNKKKIIAGILIAIALILLILLIVLIVLLTGKGGGQTSTNSTAEELLSKRRAELLERGKGNDTSKDGNDDPAGRDCPHQPPSPHGMIRSWDGMSHRTGVTIGYKCDQDPDEEQIMMVVCVEHHWKTLYQKTDSCIELLHSRRCLGDPLPASAKVPFDWDYVRRDVGTRVSYRCNPSKGSPIMRILICTRDYEWRIFSDTSDKCLCGKPLHYSPPIQAVIENWDGKTYKPGTTVKYSCHTGMGITHFQTITCLLNATWLVTKTGSCFFLVDKPYNYSDALKYCTQMGGEIYAITDESEQDAVKSLLVEENAFGSTCIHKAFLGIREDVGKQWQTNDGNYVSGISDLFFIVDEGREHCAVIQRTGNYKLNNVLCAGMQFCQMCEYGKNATNPECPSATDVCYQPKTTLGDYRSSVKQCEVNGGELARLTNLNQLATIRDILVKDSAVTAKCDTGFYVGLRNEKRLYNTFKNIPINFTKFVDDSRRSMNRHCVVIHEMQRYMWTDEHCSLPCCFMCKMTGFPVGAFTPSDYRYAPVEPSLRVLPPVGLKERGTKAFLSSRSLRFRLLDNAAVACEDYWVTDGFHCYLFNQTLVTNAEARQFCEDNYGTLASLVIPFERNFIIEHLINRINNSSDSDLTEPIRWHVESTGGLPSLNNDENSYHSSVNHQCVSVFVKPIIGWSGIDCNNLAAFICHD